MGDRTRWRGLALRGGSGRAQSNDLFETVDCRVRPPRSRRAPAKPAAAFDSPPTSLMAVNRLWIYLQVIIVICVVASFVIALIKL